MRYLVGVVGHTGRQDLIDAITDKVYPDFLHVDDGRLGPGRNHAHVLAHMHGLRSEAEWYVMLEDDALPVSGFHPQLNALLNAAPAGIVSLYNGAGYPSQYQRVFAEASRREDVEWILHRYLRHGVGYALHREAVSAGLLTRMATLTEMGWAPDDAISKWARENGQVVAYTNPSIVDHLDGTPVIKNRTHLGKRTFGRNRERKAHWVGTRLTWGARAITV